MSQQINLLVPGLRSRRAPLNAAAMAMMLAFFAAALLGYHQYARHQATTAQMQAQGAETQLKQLQASVTQLAATAKRTPNKAIEEEIARVEEKLSNWHELLERLKGSGIGNTAGHARFLEALARQHAEGVWLTHITVNESGDFTLQGKVLRPELLGGYIQQLNREESLRGRAIGQFNIAESKEPSEAKAKEARPAAAQAVRAVDFAIASASGTVETGATR